MGALITIIDNKIKEKAEWEEETGNWRRKNMELSGARKQHGDDR